MSGGFAFESSRFSILVTDPKKMKYEVTVAGYQSEAAKKTVSIIINGQAAQSKTVDIPPCGRARLEFTGIDASFGLNRGEVRIDSGDSLSADDRYLIAFDRVEPRKVLFAHDSRQARALTYLRAALESAGDTPFSLEPMSCESTSGASPA